MEDVVYAAAELYCVILIGDSIILLTPSLSIREGYTTDSCLYV